MNIPIMEVGGRQCEEITLNNGDKLYFLSRFRGYEFRKYKNLVTRMMLEAPPLPENATDKEKEAQQKEINLKIYQDCVPLSFDFVCKKIVKPDGSEVVPTLEYYDNLEDFDDWTKIFQIVDRVIQNAQKKMESSSSDSSGS